MNEEKTEPEISEQEISEPEISEEKITEPAEYVYDKGVPMVVNPSLVVFDKLVVDIRYKGQLIARNQKLDSGVGTGLKGVVIGFIFAVIMIGLPIIAKGGS
jgi:tetrahydromethanopterin S-methyltransferase subunit F